MQGAASVSLGSNRTFAAQAMDVHFDSCQPGEVITQGQNYPGLMCFDLGAQSEVGMPAHPLTLPKDVVFRFPIKRLTQRFLDAAPVGVSDPNMLWWGELFEHK